MQQRKERSKHVASDVTKLRHGAEDGIVTANARTVLLVGGFRVTNLVEFGLKIEWTKNEN